MKLLLELSVLHVTLKLPPRFAFDVWYMYLGIDSMSLSVMLDIGELASRIACYARHL